MTSEESHRGFGIELPGSYSVRRLVFYGAVVAALGLYVGLMHDLLPLVVTAWIVDTGSHRLHDLNFFALIWISIFGLTLQLYRPTRRITAAVAPVLIMAPLAVMAFSTGSPIAMMPVLFTIIGLVVVALHPTGRGLIRLDRVQSVDLLAAGLVGAAAVPLFGYAYSQLTMQYTIADEHAALVHYGGMALIAVLILVMGSLAVLRESDWRFAAWTAGLLAFYLGASSLAFPNYVSSAGSLWGGMAIIWGLVFVAAVELDRDTDDLSMRVESSIEIDAPVETVWEITTDPETFVDGIDWVYDVWREDEGPLGEGSVYIERAKPGLTENEYRWEITAYEPPNRIVHYHNSRELEAELEVLTEPVDDETTQYTQIMHFRAFPVFRPLGFVLERLVMKRQMLHDFDEMILPNYKQIIEAQRR